MLPKFNRCFATPGICTGCVHLLRHTCGGLVHENVKVVYNASADTGVVAGSDNLSYLLGKWALFT